MGKAALCLALYVLAVMAKPMAVTFPAAMLVLDYWPLGRLPSSWRTTLKEKIPFFLAALAFSALAVATQTQWGALSSQESFGLPFMAMNAFHSLAFYLWKMLLPVHLLPFYPLVPGAGAFSPGNLGAVLSVLLVSWACFSSRHTRPYCAAAWLYYLATLAPVLGVLQFGSQAAADRYTYLPSLGPFLLLGTWAALSYRKNTPLAFLFCLLLAGGLGALTWRQTGLWRDSVTLWEKVAKAYPGVSQTVHSNLANAYRAAGRPDDAVSEYDKAIAIGPPRAYPHDGKGVALLDKGLTEEAVHEFQEAVALDSQDLSAHRHLWLIYQKLGRRQEALEEFQEAARLVPGFAGAGDNPGTGDGAQTPDQNPPPLDQTK
jgi:tetratricopeptide (TPR) repeat protein